MYTDRDRMIRRGKRPLSILMAVALALPLMVAMASVGSAGLNDCSASADARNDTTQANSTTVNPDTALIFDNDAEVDQEQEIEQENEHENEQSTDNDNLNLQEIDADTITDIDSEQENESDNTIGQANLADVENLLQQIAELITTLSITQDGDGTPGQDGDGNSATATQTVSNTVTFGNLSTITRILQDNTARIDNPQSNDATFGPITGATVTNSVTQTADGDNTNDNPQSNDATQEQTSLLDNSITTGEISPRTRVDAPVSLSSNSDARGGAAEGGDCTLELDQRTGDTGDVSVEATSGNVTQGDVTGGDGGDTNVEMGVGGDGGGGGAAGGSGKFAGAVVGNNNGGGGGGPGGPGGHGSCEDCSVIVTDSNNGGGAQGGEARSGDVEVQDTTSGDSGDNVADLSESGDATIEGGDEVDPESGDEDSPNATNTND